MLGSLVLEIDGDRLDVTFVTSDAEMGDWFTIQKSVVVQRTDADPATGADADRDSDAHRDRTRRRPRP